MSRENHFFFENDGSKLFGVLHTPENPNATGSGVVFVDPWGSEKIYSTKAYADFARAICDMGLYALRFDARGTGDSEGNQSELTLSSQLADTRKAVDILAERGVNRIGLLGLRVGCAVAARAASEDGRIGFLVLWDPISRLQEHFDGIYRSEVKASAWTEQRIHPSLILDKELHLNGQVHVRDFRINHQSYLEFSEIDMRDLISRYSGDVFAGGLVANKESEPTIEKSLKEMLSGNNHEIQVVKEYVFWTALSLEQEERKPGNLFRVTLEWLRSRDGATWSTQ